MKLTSWLIPLSLPLSLMAGASGAQAAAPDGHRLAFVVKDWFTAIYETKFMDECPEGVSTANDEFWWRKLSPAEWNRGGIHALRGRLTLDSFASLMAWHDDNHLDQLRRALEGRA